MKNKKRGTFTAGWLTEGQSYPGAPEQEDEVSPALAGEESNAFRGGVCEELSRRLTVIPV